MLPLLALLCVSLAPLSSAYSDGAPGLACLSLTPMHGMGPQPGIGFYTIMTEQTKKGVMGLLTTSGAETFEGWMIQAREVGSDRILGRFDVDATPDGLAKGLTCTRRKYDTLTHAGAGCAAGGGSYKSSEEEEKDESGDEESGEEGADAASEESMEKDDEEEEDDSDEEGSKSDNDGKASGEDGLSELRELQFLWVPPSGYSGEVRFVAAVVEDFSTFFVGIESDVVQVQPMEQQEEEEE